MIIVHLNGGLGNQLFQYALGRRLSKERNVLLRFDLDAYQNQNELRTYKLNHFRVKGRPASTFDMARVSPQKASSLPGKIFYHLFRQKNFIETAIIVEKQRTFEPKILQVPKNAYLRGYWQTEKYFRDIRGLLLTELQLIDAPDERNLSMTTLIQRSSPSVSIHIRRGDYVSNPSASRFHGLLPLDYYYKAMQFVKGKIAKPHFFVFSDDIPWAKQNLKIDDPITFVDHNTAESDHFDFALMSRCNHHIVANSSFSWWSAWLADSPDKIIIAPRQWYVIQDDTRRDLIPETWFRL